MQFTIFDVYQKGVLPKLLPPNKLEQTAETKSLAAGKFLISFHNF